MSPIVKNCSRRSACLPKNAATSFCSQSATSCVTFSSDFGSSIRFMAYSRGFSQGGLFKKLHGNRVRVGFTTHETHRQCVVFICELIEETAQQHIFGGFFQAKLSNGQLTIASCLGLEC